MHAAARAYQMMVRSEVSGSQLTTGDWLAWTHIAETYRLIIR